MTDAVRQPPYDFELYRRGPVLDMTPAGSFNPTVGTMMPLVVVDNSGAALPAGCFIGSFPLSSGAVGINKTAEYCVQFLPTTGAVPQDILAAHGDPTTHGFWRRTLIFDGLIVLRSKAGTPTATTRAGFGLGSYGAVPPDPATTLNNVIRLYCRYDTQAWELMTHAGDGSQAQLITAMPAIPAGVMGRAYKLRIVYKPGEYISAAVNGIVGATTGIPAGWTIPPTGSHPSVISYFVTSGSSSANARAWVHRTNLQALGIG